MKSSFASALTLIAAVVFGFGFIYSLSDYLETVRPPLPEGFEDSDLLLQGARLKGFAFGAEGLIADWYWMKSLQYVGDKILKNPDKNIGIDNLKPLNPRLLYPYLDNATTLDPKFTSVYEYGANVLPAIDQRQAIKLIEKGIADNPEQWRFYHYLGYIYWEIGEYEKASQVYETGSKINSAPVWMKLMSAKLKAQGGSRDTARSLYLNMFENASDEQTKESVRLRLLELDSLDERDAVRIVLRDFQTRSNRCANNWQEIFPLLKNVKLPNNRNFSVDVANNLVDPSGAPYVLLTDKCDISLNYLETKIPHR